MIKKILKKLVKAILWLLVPFFLYVPISFLGSIIPVQDQVFEGEKNIDVYVISNGVHVDFVVPISHEVFNWKEFLGLSMFLPNYADQFQYVAFGYGDKGFYLETPTWDDLKASTVVNALFLPSETAMHVSGYFRAPKTGEKCIHLQFNETEYKLLIAHIQSGFVIDSMEHPEIIEGAHYGKYDLFYKGSGSYNFVNTCNEWINMGLKKSGQKGSLWSPYDFGIFYQLRP